MIYSLTAISYDFYSTFFELRAYITFSYHVNILLLGAFNIPEYVYYLTNMQPKAIVPPPNNSCNFIQLELIASILCMTLPSNLVVPVVPYHPPPLISSNSILKPHYDRQQNQNAYHNYNKLCITSLWENSWEFLYSINDLSLTFKHFYHITVHHEFVRLQKLDKMKQMLTTKNTVQQFKKILYNNSK